MFEMTIKLVKNDVVLGITESSTIPLTIQELVENPVLAASELETIFNPKPIEGELNLEDTTVDKDEWSRFRETHKNMQRSPELYTNKEFHDDGGVEYLSPVIERYMTYPTALYKGNLVEALTLKLQNIKDVRNRFISEGKKIILHSLVYHSSTPVYVVDPSIDPGIVPGYWRIRYAEIPNNTDQGYENVNQNSV
jgi:hypothetical protein